MKIPAINPAVIAGATIARGTGPVNVEQKYSNIEVIDSFAGKITKADAAFTDDGVELHLRMHIPKYTFKADYNFNGHVLLLPIVGDGKVTMVITDQNSTLHVVAKKIEKEGKCFYDANDVELKFKYGGVVFNFENLFKGNEQLGVEMNNLLNENWEEVSKDVKSGYEEMTSNFLKNYINSIFSIVSCDELFPQ